MQDFLHWVHAARARFAEGKFLLSAQGGTKRFFTLFTRNVAVFFLIFFDTTLFILVPVCAVAWGYGTLPLMMTYVIWSYAILFATSIGLATFFSVFDLPQYDRELAFLDVLIPKLLPLPHAETLYSKATRRSP